MAVVFTKGSNATINREERDKSVEGSYVTETEKEEERRREAERNRKAGIETEGREKKRARRQREESTARTNRLALFAVGADLNLGLHSDQSVLYRRARILSTFDNVSPGSRKYSALSRRMHESSIQNHTRREREREKKKEEKIHRAQHDRVVHIMQRDILRQCAFFSFSSSDVR